ncbi:zinc-finger homeodomain protein 2-like isoform X2 [Lolium rigidum]|uniref:zinc-finger homeodomain protein 2-like isoform X2 n=1 Tax=Lolium rigidum TaxID=89674 RepID=UPI001F5DFE1E|nr:zinc-finger homeodomain protein 2-like isoform X2 [Lolium rigidum]
MDFDEHDDDEEMAPMPVSSSYEVPVQLGGGGVPKPAGSGGGVGGAGGVRYRECLKNHAVGIGGHAVDGCGEFMAAGEEGSIDALRCAACGCHRNFHRKESDSPTGAEAAGVSSTAITAYGALPPPHHQFSPYYRTPAGYLQHQHHHQMATAAAVAAAGHAHRPLALPSTSYSEADDVSGMLSPMVMGSMLGMPFGSAGPSGSGSGSGKKRFRTRFSQEQKDKMQAFAERLGWRIQKHDEAAVQQFCEEVGVKRHVLKVWMHNNKHTLGKKP